MSVFKNISGRQLLIQGYLKDAKGALGQGAMKYIDPESTFNGSNYYDRFTYDGMIAMGVDAKTAAEEAILKKTTDDGLPFSFAGNIPNLPKTYTIAIAAGEDETIDFETDLKNPAMFMTLTTDQDVTVKLNSLDTAATVIKANAAFSFGVGEMLLSSIIILNGTESTANVQVVVGVVSE